MGKRYRAGTLLTNQVRIDLCMVARQDWTN